MKLIININFKEVAMLYYIETKAEERARYGREIKKERAKQVEGRKEDLLCKIGLC